MNDFYPDSRLVELNNGEVLSSLYYREKTEPSGGLDWEKYTGVSNAFRTLPWELRTDFGIKLPEENKSFMPLDPNNIFTGSGAVGDALKITASGVAFGPVETGDVLPTGAEQYQPLCWDGSKWTPMWLTLI